MEGRSRRSVPAVERSFVSSRLAEDLLSSVYERLLGTSRGRRELSEVGRSGKTRDGGHGNTEQEALISLARGGR